MLVLSVQGSQKVLLFANIRSLIAYFEYGTFHQFCVGLEILGERHDGWKPWIGRLSLLTQPAITCSKLTTETLERRCEICSKLTIKTPKRRHFGVFIVNFELISHLCSSVSIVNFEQVNVYC